MEQIIAEHFTAPGKYEIDLAFEEHEKLILITEKQIDKGFGRLNSILNPKPKKPTDDYLNTNYNPIPIK